MKLQTIAKTILLSQCITITSAKTLRGSNNSNSDTITSRQLHDDSSQQHMPALYQERRDPHADALVRTHYLTHRELTKPTPKAHYRVFKEGAISEDYEVEAALDELHSNSLLPALVTADATTPNNKNNNNENAKITNNQLDKDPRIIGGTQAGGNEFPFSVSMQDNIGHFCGGSLITPNLVLTAAHCLGGNYDVVVGRSNLNSNSGVVIPKKQEIEYPNYRPSTTDGDWAILVLDGSCPDCDMVKLNSANNYPPVGEQVTVMGYGNTNPNGGSLSDNLMKVNVNVISNSDCDDSSDGRDDYYGQITNKMLCANVNGGGKDACQGDSGGPLVGTNDSGELVQVGVVSWGIGCAEAAFPGVYARVSEAYDWIQQTVCDKSVDPIPAHFGCGGGGGGNNNPTPTPPTPPSPPSPSPPSPSPPSPTPPTQPTGGAASDSGNWRTVMQDDFSGGLGNRSEGKFKKDNNGVKMHNSHKWRDHVLEVQKKGMATTDFIDVSGKSKCRVKHDLYMLRLTSSDKVCIEYSAGGGNSFTPASCYTHGSTNCNGGKCNNKRWFTNEVTSEFSVKKSDKVQLRLRMYANNNKKDGLFDQVALECK